MYQINSYENLKNSYVKNSTTIDEWLQLIKSSDYSNSILAARPFGKKHKLYNEVKAVLPAVTYNFLFNNKKANANIISGTGLLYIDVDDDSFDVSSLDNSKIFAYYKSFGGLGYSILVQVSGLSLDNYSATYSDIVEQLGITSIYDKQAKKATQFTVLSYDPNIFINYDSLVFQAIETPVDDNGVIVHSVHEQPDMQSTYNADASSPIRFNNLNEINIMGNYAFNWDGWTYINCWLPMKKIATGNRNSTLLSYCNNLVWLNPQLTVAGAISILKNVTRTACEEPVSDTQIKSIVDSIFRYKVAGTLKPIRNKKDRKIVFANHSGLNRDEKFAICRELLAERNQNNSLEKLDNIIRTWNFDVNGKITQSAIVKIGKMGNKTVEKYWYQFKELVKELNDNFTVRSNVIKKKKKIYTTDLTVKNTINMDNTITKQQTEHQLQVQLIEDSLVLNIGNDYHFIENFKPTMQAFTSYLPEEQKQSIYNNLMTAPQGTIKVMVNQHTGLQLYKSVTEDGIFCYKFNRVALSA